MQLYYENETPPLDNINVAQDGEYRYLPWCQEGVVPALPPPPPLLRDYPAPILFSGNRKFACASLSKAGTSGFEMGRAVLPSVLLLPWHAWVFLTRATHDVDHESGLASDLLAILGSRADMLAHVDPLITQDAVDEMHRLYVFCGSGTNARPGQEWPSVKPSASPTVEADLCRIAGVAVLRCPTNAADIPSLPSDSYVSPSVCPTANRWDAEVWPRIDTEIFAFSSPEECAAAVGTTMNSASYMQDSFGAHARVGGVSPDTTSRACDGQCAQMAQIPVKRSNFQAQLQFVPDILKGQFDSYVWPLLECTLYAKYSFAVDRFRPTKCGTAHYVYTHAGRSTVPVGASARSHYQRMWNDRMDEELNDLARAMLPLMDLRTLSGAPCTVAATWDGLFGDGNPGCYINAQVGSKYDAQPLCFPAGAQLRTESGTVLNIEDVRLGDRVQIIGAAGTSSFAAVHTISHADADRVAAFCYATADGRNVTAECNNFVPAGNASNYSESRLKTMRDLEVDDVIFTAFDGAATVSAAVVTAVGIVSLQGLYHLHANVATAVIVIDGVVVSELANLNSVTGDSTILRDFSGISLSSDFNNAVSLAASDMQKVVNSTLEMIMNGANNVSTPPAFRHAFVPSALAGLQAAIEASSGTKPVGIGENITTVFTPRAQMGLLRLAHLMFASLGTALKNQADAKLLLSEWFFTSASQDDIKHLYLLGEAFAATVGDTSTLHLTEQPTLTTSGLVSAIGATSIYHALSFLFDTGFFSNANDGDWSLTDVLDRTGILAVLRGGSVTVGEVDVNEATGVGVPQWPDPPPPSQPPSQPAEMDGASDGTADSATTITTGAVIGITFGSIAVFAVGVAACFLFVKRRAKTVLPYPVTTAVQHESVT